MHPHLNIHNSYTGSHPFTVEEENRIYFQVVASLPTKARLENIHYRFRLEKKMSANLTRGSRNKRQLIRPTIPA